MAIKVTLSDIVGINVKGNYNDEKGVVQPFDFKLICKRLTAPQIDKKINDDGMDYVDFIAEVTQDWLNVLDDAGKQLPYSESELRRIFTIPGVPFLAYASYRVEAGVRAAAAKN